MMKRSTKRKKSPSAQPSSLLSPRALASLRRQKADAAAGTVSGSREKKRIQPESLSEISPATKLASEKFFKVTPPQKQQRVAESPESEASSPASTTVEICTTEIFEDPALLCKETCNDPQCMGECSLGRSRKAWKANLKAMKAMKAMKTKSVPMKAMKGIMKATQAKKLPMKSPKAMKAAMKAMKAKSKTSKLKSLYGPEDDCAYSSELED